MFEASGEILLIAAVALVVLGPSKFPEIFRMFGRTVGEFRRMTADVKSTLEREIERAEELKRIEETKNELFGESSNPDPLGVAFGPGHDANPAPSAQAPTETTPAEPAQASAPASQAAEAAPAPAEPAPHAAETAPSGPLAEVQAFGETASPGAPSVSPEAAQATPETVQAAGQSAPAPTREELISQGFGTGHSFASGPPPGQPAKPAAPQGDNPATGQSQDKSHA